MELPSLPITHLLSYTVHWEPLNTNHIYLRMLSLLISMCLSVVLVVICLFKMFSGLTEKGPPRAQASEQLVIFMVPFGMFWRRYCVEPYWMKHITGGGLWEFRARLHFHCCHQKPSQSQYVWPCCLWGEEKTLFHGSPNWRLAHREGFCDDLSPTPTIPTHLKKYQSRQDTMEENS